MPGAGKSNPAPITGVGIPTALADDPARIQVADPFNWWRLYIDRGSSDGVMENTPVLCPQGLVGKVEQVEAGRSLVRLVGDPHCRVAAVLEPVAAAKPLRAAWDHHGGPNPHGIPAWFPFSTQSMSGWNLGVRWSPVAWGRLSKGCSRRPDRGQSSCGVRALVEARVILGVDLNELEMVWLPLPQNRKEIAAQPK